MKKALIALVCTLGAVGCGGDKRPAEEPSGLNTTVTTETTTTGASNAQRSATPSSTSTPDVTSMPRTDTTPSTSSTSSTSSTPSTPSTATSPTTGTPPVIDNPGSANNTKDADNTKINDRDRHGALTPTNQGGGSDRDITAAIRRSVVGDKALSFAAKNVKIVVVGGKVTLRGPVKSDQEKSAIEAKAKAAPGVSEVDNQLEVKK